MEAITRMNPLWKNYRTVIFLVIGSLVMGVSLAIAPLASIALLTASTLFWIGYIKPYLLIFLALGFGFINLATFTGHQKSLFESLGGIDFNGIRLIATTGTLLVIGLFRGYFKKLPLKIYTLFLLLSFFSLSYSAAPFAGLRTLMKLLYPYLLFLAIRFESQDPQFPASLKKSLYVAAIMMIVLSGIMFLSGTASDYAPGGVGLVQSHVEQKRFMGPTGNWAGTAAFSALFGLFFYSRFLLERKWISLLLFISFLPLLMLTLSRIEIAAFAVGFFLMNLFLKKRSVALIGILSVFLLSLAYAPLRNKSFHAEMESFSDTLAVDSLSDIHDTGRWQLWALTIPLILKNPLIGNGLGSTESLLGGEEGDEGGYVPHNEYLRLSSDVGFIGCLLFLISYIVLGHSCWKKFKTGDRADQHQALLAITSILVYLMICLADNGIDWYATATQYVWAFVALALFSNAPKISPRPV